MVDSGKDFLAGLSRQGQVATAHLAGASDELHAAFAAHPKDARRALYAASRFAAALDEIDELGSAHAGEGAGPRVPDDDARRNGALIAVEPDGGLHPTALGDALKERMAEGVPFVIAGAGLPLADLLEEVPTWRGRLGTAGLVLQYAGIDRQHWEPGKAARVLEANLLQAAAAQVLNSAMNKAGRRCLVVSIGFGCWVANRALRMLPLRKVWFARNLQIDALGSHAVMGELVRAKKGGFGAICHVQGRRARQALAQGVKVPPAALKAMPVDIRA
jgi:hypothetical protein